MKITVWTLTTEGNNAPMETTVHATEQAACEALLAGIVSFCKSYVPPAASSSDALTELWEEVADGPASIEAHTLELHNPEL